MHSDNDCSPAMRKDMLGNTAAEQASLLAHGGHASLSPRPPADGATHMHEAQQTVQLLQEDVNKLRAQVVDLLRLDRPGKDSHQFRSAVPATHSSPAYMGTATRACSV
eukprot:jgi/Ulvmu1/8584/UM045_0027.1